MKNEVRLSIPSGAIHFVENAVLGEAMESPLPPVRDRDGYTILDIVGDYFGRPQEDWQVLNQTLNLFKSKLSPSIMR